MYKAPDMIGMGYVSSISADYEAMLRLEPENKQAKVDLATVEEVSKPQCTFVVICY